MNSPLKSAYENAIAQNIIKNDFDQRVIIEKLDALSDAINKQNSWFSKKRNVCGIYLYGPVGRGKSFLVNLFFNSLTTKKKLKLHFHTFMQQIDAELRKLRITDPLSAVAINLSKSAKVICLDEFLIHDIADAMIIAKLLPYLFKHNIVLVITANTPPDELYLNGLQRREFLPAISLLKENCEVLNLAGNTDYRLKELEELTAYLWPINYENEKKMESEFKFFSLKVQENQVITIQNRKLLCKRLSESAVWFDFDIICNIPRSQLDYLELARKFKVFFISGLMPLNKLSPSRVVLFIKLIDILYDNKNKLILLASIPIDEIYTEGSFITTFERTLSRLKEMGRTQYLTSN